MRAEEREREREREREPANKHRARGGRAACACRVDCPSLSRTATARHGVGHTGVEGRRAGGSSERGVRFEVFLASAPRAHIPKL